MAKPLVCVQLCWSFAPRHVEEMTLQVPAGSWVQTVLELGIAQCLQMATVPHANAKVLAETVDELQGQQADVAQLKSLHRMQPGIWGRIVPWTQVVQDGDRIELYRPLKVDPKVARRQRFKRQGKGRTGLFANRKSGSAAGY